MAALVCLTAFLAMKAEAQASENPLYLAPRGPIPIRSMRPYDLLFLQFPPDSGDALAAGKDRFRFQLDVANNMLIPRPNEGATVVEDNEYQRLSLEWRRGIGKQTEIGLNIPTLWRNGGFTDELIQAYHNLIGYASRQRDIPQGRDSYPQNRSILEVIDASGNTRIRQGNAFGLGETTVTVKHSLISQSRRSALALRFGLKLPTGNPTLLLGSGGVDAGLSLDARYGMGRDIILYANVGGAINGPARRAPGSQPSRSQGFLGLEYRPNNRDSFFFQFDSASLALKTGNKFADGVGTEATFGYKRILDRHAILIASFSENGGIDNYSAPYIANIGPNIFSLGIEWLP